MRLHNFLFYLNNLFKRFLLLFKFLSLLENNLLNDINFSYVTFYIINLL